MSFCKRKPAGFIGYVIKKLVPLINCQTHIWNVFEPKIYFSLFFNDSNRRIREKKQISIIEKRQ